MAIDPRVRTYDPKQLYYSWGGIPLNTGQPDDTFLSIELPEDIYEKVRGAGGEIARVNKNVYDATITCTWMQTNIVIDQVIALATADQLTNESALPFTAIDINGTSIFEYPQAWVQTMPTVDYSNSMSNRQIVFATGPGIFKPGGNL